MRFRGVLLRLQARAGVRLALVQTLIVVLAFGLAGYLVQIALQQISQASIRAHVAGEVASLDDEYGQKGAQHLPYTVAKRSRLWRGFDYRLLSPDGALLAGKLPVAAALGWSRLSYTPQGGARRNYFAYTKRMPDGARLTVGQDLAVEAGEMAAIDRSLLMCGLLGVLFCVGASYLFARGTWRRIAAVAATAQAVSQGRLTVRVDAHPGPARDDIDELSSAFNEMLDRIGVLMAQVRQVSTDIAHDLRTPLTRFNQKLERLHAAAGTDPLLLREIRGLEDDVAEILRTFDALLQLSEIEAADRGERHDIADLAEVAARVGEAYRPDIEESGRSLIIDVRPALVKGDGDLLAQGLANLLENALRHTQKGSRVKLTVNPLPDGAELCVEDDGPGIAREHRQRALKPFVRLEPSRSAGGSGLGLAIVAAVAARHAARLSLEDAAPGLRIGLSFPAIAPR
jgi:hypothetical protein